MALPVHGGTAASDLEVTGTYRADISDVLAASLKFEENILYLTQVGEEFADLACQWVEDKLNQQTVTDTAGIGASGGVGTLNNMTMSAADVAVLAPGYILQRDDSFITGEQVRVETITGTTVQVSRQYGGSTGQNSGASVLWRVVGTPAMQNSDLGADQSRARLNKQNLIYRMTWDVNLAAEAIIRADLGYVPGVTNELWYQYYQRFMERRRQFQAAYFNGLIATAGSPGGASAAAGGDNSTMYGLAAWLNGTANANSTQTSTAQVLTDLVLDNEAETITKNGAVSNVIVAGVKAMSQISRMYSDRIRIEQNEHSRGFFARYFTPTTGNEHLLVADGQLNDTSGSAQLFMLDMSRIRLRPFARCGLGMIKAPTFRIGDALRGFSFMSLEVRNSGSDSGQAHRYISNLSY